MLSLCSGGKNLLSFAKRILEGTQCHTLSSPGSPNPVGRTEGEGLLALPLLYVPGSTCPVCASNRSKLISCPKPRNHRAARFRILSRAFSLTLSERICLVSHRETNKLLVEREAFAEQPQVPRILSLPGASTLPNSSNPPRCSLQENSKRTRKGTRLLKAKLASTRKSHHRPGATGSESCHFRTLSIYRACDPRQAYSRMEIHMGSVAQLVSAPGCGPGGRGFESRRSSQRIGSWGSLEFANALRSPEFTFGKRPVGYVST